MTGLAQLTLANGRLFFRVRQEVFLAFALPILFMVVLGTVLSNVPDIGSVTNEALGLEVGVVLADDGPRTAVLLDALHDMPNMRIVTVDATGGLAELESGALAALVILPAEARQPAMLEVRYNRTRTQRSRVVLNTLHEAVAAANSAELGHVLPVGLHIEPVGGEDDYSSYVDFFIPGVIAMAVFPGVVFSLTPTLVNHRERGVLRRLWLTPASLRSYLLSHVLFRVGLALLQAGVILATAALVFGRPFHYGWLRLLVLCIAGSLAGSAVAVLLAAIARTQAAGVTIAQLTMIPMLLACGAFFPLELMPPAAMPFINLLPLTPLAAGLRGVLNFNHPLSDVLPAVLILGVYTVGAGGLGLRLFHWDNK